MLAPELTAQPAPGPGPAGGGAERAPARRVVAIDAARGAAMVLVCFSHFSWALIDWQTAVYEAITLLTMIATPTFMVISGTMLGYLFVRAGPRWPNLSCRLVNRGLFLLTVGHLLTIPTFYFDEGAWWGAWMRVLNTDAIAFAVIFDAALIAYFGVRWAFVQGLALMALSWLLLVSWQPDDFLPRLLREVWLGQHGTATVLKSTAPLIPFLAMHHAAIPLGAWLGRTELSQRIVIIRRLFVIGAVMVAAAVGAWAASQGIQRVYAVTGYGDQVLWSLLSPLAKKPPGPAYVLFYGGVGTLMLATIWLVSNWPVLRIVVRELSIIGRASLFVFMLQWWVYGPLLHAAGFGDSVWWPLEFAATLLLILLAARLWVRFDGNRLLTVGWRCRGAGGSSAFAGAARQAAGTEADIPAR